jgi:hypothetical protein
MAGNANPTPTRGEGYWILGSLSVIAPVLWWNLLLSGVLARATDVVAVGSGVGLVLGACGGAVVCLAALTGKVPERGKLRLFLLGAVGVAFSVCGFGPLLLMAGPPR